MKSTIGEYLCKDHNALSVTDRGKKFNQPVYICIVRILGYYCV